MSCYILIITMIGRRILYDGDYLSYIKLDYHVNKESESIQKGIKTNFDDLEVFKRKFSTFNNVNCLFVAYNLQEINPCIIFLQSTI